MKLLRTEAEMVQAYRDRIRELGLAHSTVDAISGLPDGYTSKLMCDPPMKGIGPKARELLNGALGMGFVVAVDPEQVEKVQGRWTRRRRAIDKKKRLPTSLSMSLSIDNEVPAIMRITPELQAHLRSPNAMREIGLRGNLMRNKRLSPWQRKVLARRAAKARWSKSSDKAVRC